MRTLAPLLAAATLAFAAPVVAAPIQGSPDVVDSSQTAASGERILQLSVVVAAARAEVWRLFATGEGLQKWQAPVAAVDLRIGGSIKASYQAGSTLADDTTVAHEIVAYVPQSVLVYRNVKTPKGFPWPEQYVRIRQVAEFEAIDSGHTRLTLSGVGYGAQDQAMFDFFRSGNAEVLEMIKAAAEHPAGAKH